MSEDIRLGDIVTVRKSLDPKEMKRGMVVEIVTTTAVSLARTFESKTYLVRFIDLDEEKLRGMRGRKVDYGVYRGIDLRVVWTMKDEYEKE